MWMIYLQEANSKTHKASKVVFLGNMKMLLTSGTSRWNERQIALWDQVRPAAGQLCTVESSDSYRPNNFNLKFLP